MTEVDFTKVMAPKITGARVLHNAFREQRSGVLRDVRVGGIGRSPRPAKATTPPRTRSSTPSRTTGKPKGLPALTIGWGPWSVGMVEELKLEKIYAQRGIELITPAAGTRILDRLINQKIANVVAISADWMRARRAGLGGQLPPMFSELGTAETSPDTVDPDSSILDFLSECPEAERLDAVAGHVRQIAAAVFEIAAADIGPDDALDDIGLDSMMAMDFRLRINAMFAIDLPLLEILRGVSVNSVAARILAELQLADADPAAATGRDAEPTAADDDVDRLIEQLSDAELREVLAELEKHEAGRRS